MNDKQFQLYVGHTVRQARQNQGMSQFDLEKKSGITQTSITQIETGHRNPSILTLKKLFDNMGYDLEFTVKVK